MNVREIGSFGGSKEIVDALSSAGVTEFYPPQALAIKAGLLAGDESFVISSPTASGKTLIAEIAALKVFFERRGKIVYTVPLRALAREKYDDFTRKYAGTGLKVAQSTGDYDSAAPWLRDADIIISTNEKIDSLIRHRAPWLPGVSLVVADEVHLMGDESRGPTLEIVLTRLMWRNTRLRLLALSATIPNAAEIAQWLGARLVQSDWRPVPLREGVYYGEAVIFNDGTVTWVERESPDDAVSIALDTIRDGGQALVFVNTRKAAESTALKSSSKIGPLLGDQEKKMLEKLSKELAAGSLEPTRLGKKIAELAESGVAFHHAGVLSSQRRLIEDAFRANRIKLVAATTTLAMGLNLPSRRVIIRDWWRYESGAGMRPLPVLEIKQMAGRAGRPGFDKYGEAVLVARNKRDERHLFENYIKGEPEDIESQLENESVLRAHILASIAGGFTKNREDLNDFLAHTFYARRKDKVRLASMTDGIVHFLIREDMVKADMGLSATRFGHRVSELYIDPLTGVMLRDALRTPEEKLPFPLLHMIARTPDMMVLQLKKKDVDRVLEVYSANAKALLIPDEERHPTEELLGQIKTAWLLVKWVSETPEDGITGLFDVGPGDLHTIVELSDWLLYAASEIAKIFNLKKEQRIISFLRIRVAYGVKEELIPLVALKGIGRIRARNLFNAGYKTREDIGKATVAELEKIPTVGRKIAEDIRRQAILSTEQSA